MNSFKLVSMFIGVIAAAAIAATPFAAFAQGTQPAPAPTSPARSARPRIVLTQEQQTRFEAIQKNAIAAIEKVLTPEQKKQFADGRENGQGLGAIQNLSDSQKTDILGILKTANSQIGELLTPEQKDQIRQSQPNPQSNPQ